MPDDQKIDQAAGAETDKQQNAGEDSKAGTGQETDKKPEATTTGTEDAGKGEEGKGEGDNKDSQGGEQNKNAKAPEKEPSQEGEDDKLEPEVRERLSAQKFIIERQKKKIAKLKSGDQNGEENEETGEDSEIAPEDEALIRKVVSPLIAPFIGKSIEAEDEKEVKDFVDKNPDFKPYEAKVRRYMQHPSRRQLPVESIFYEVAGKDLVKIGAERQKAADEKARNSQTGGGSNRAGEGKKSVLDMTPEEFEAKKNSVRQSQS